MSDSDVIKILTDALVSIIENAPPASPTLEWGGAAGWGNSDDAEGYGYRIAHQELAGIARNALEQTGLTPA